MWRQTSTAFAAAIALTTRRVLANKAPVDADRRRPASHRRLDEGDLLLCMMPMCATPYRISRLKVAALPPFRQGRLHSRIGVRQTLHRLPMAHRPPVERGLVFVPLGATGSTAALFCPPRTYMLLGLMRCNTFRQWAPHFPLH